MLQKFNEFKEKLAQKFKKPVQPIPEPVPEVRDDCRPGDEMTQELTDAWNLFTRVKWDNHNVILNQCYWQGANEIPSKQIGYILRILGQNPTEDDIVEMVMKVCVMCVEFTICLIVV